MSENVENNSETTIVSVSVTQDNIREMLATYGVQHEKGRLPLKALAQSILNEGHHIVPTDVLRAAHAWGGAGKSASVARERVVADNIYRVDYRLVQRDGRLSTKRSVFFPGSAARRVLTAIPARGSLSTSAKMAFAAFLAGVSTSEMENVVVEKLSPEVADEMREEVTKDVMAAVEKFEASKRESGGETSEDAAKGEDTEGDVPESQDSSEPASV